MLFPFVRSSTLSGAVAMPFVLLLAACATQPAPPAEAEALPPPPAVPRVMPVEAEPKAPATQPASLFTLMTQGPAAAMLAYADKVRPLGGAELAAEITRAGDPGDSPTAQMQLALLLAQTRVPADLARALGLMQRVISNPSPEAQPLQPLPHALPESGSEWHEGDSPGVSNRCPKARIQPGRDGRSHQPATRAIVRARVAGA